MDGNEPERQEEGLETMMTDILESLDGFNPLDNAYVRRGRKIAEDNWRYIFIGVAAWAVLSALVYLIARAIIRRRRKTFWERALAYLEGLGRQGGDLVQRLKELYGENVDSDRLAKQIAGRIRNVEKELRGVDRTISSVASRGRKLVKRFAP